MFNSSQVIPQEGRVMTGWTADPRTKLALERGREARGEAVRVFWRRVSGKRD